MQGLSAFQSVPLLPATQNSSNQPEDCYLITSFFQKKSEKKQVEITRKEHLDYFVQVQFYSKIFPLLNTRKHQLYNKH